MRIVKLTQKERENILENLLKRSPNQYSKFETTVRDILDKVKAEGDQALFAYTEQFDGVKINEETFRVTEEEIAEALGVAVNLNAGAALVYSARTLDAVKAFKE